MDNENLKLLDKVLNLCIILQKIVHLRRIVIVITVMAVTIIILKMRYEVL